MVNITHPFNTTGEFWAQVLNQASYATGSGTITGIFLFAMFTYLVYKFGGWKGAIPFSTASVLLLAKSGLLPQWTGVVVFMLVALTFSVLVYERWLNR